MGELWLEFFFTISLLYYSLNRFVLDSERIVDYCIWKKNWNSSVWEGRENRNVRTMSVCLRVARPAQSLSTAGQECRRSGRTGSASEGEGEGQSEGEVRVGEGRNELGEKERKRERKIVFAAESELTVPIACFLSKKKKKMGHTNVSILSGATDGIFRTKFTHLSRVESLTISCSTTRWHSRTRKDKFFTPRKYERKNGVQVFIKWWKFPRFYLSHT